MKRLISLLLCLTMMIGLVIPALADDLIEEDEILGEEDDYADEASYADYDEAFDDELYGSDADDGLEPLSEQELLNILAEDGDFVVLPDDCELTGDNVFTLLLVGSDAYNPDKRGRSDCVILVQLNVEARTIKMVSFLRDMYVSIPGKGHNRLNASYIWGGHKILRKTLKNNFGVEADAYVEVNFTRMIDVIDRIGGIDVDVSEVEMTQVNSILRFYNTKTGSPESDQLLKTYGPNTHLTGKQALCFARIRKIDGDVQRTARQRKVLEACYRKVVSMDYDELLNLVVANMDAVRTDLSLEQLFKLVPMALRCRNATFETLTIPYKRSYKQATRDGMSVVVFDAGRNRDKIWDFLAVDDD